MDYQIIMFRSQKTYNWKCQRTNWQCFYKQVAPYKKRLLCLTKAGMGYYVLLTGVVTILAFVKSSDGKHLLRKRWIKYKRFETHHLYSVRDFYWALQQGPGPQPLLPRLGVGPGQGQGGPQLAGQHACGNEEHTLYSNPSVTMDWLCSCL